MSEQDVTICAKCKHHHHNKQDGPRTKVWYNWFCRHPAVKRQVGIDAVTGDECYHTKNALGDIVTTDEPFPNCREINDGYCGLYVNGEPDECDGQHGGLRNRRTGFNS